MANQTNNNFSHLYFNHLKNYPHYPGTFQLNQSRRQCCLIIGNQAFTGYNYELFLFVLVFLQLSLWQYSLKQPTLKWVFTSKYT